MKTTYNVSVSNIGIVHTGTNKKKAIKEFNENKALIKAHYGNWNGETVTLYTEDDILKDFGSELFEQQ